MVDLRALGIFKRSEEWQGLRGEWRAAAWLQQSMRRLRIFTGGEGKVNSLKVVALRQNSNPKEK